MKYLTIIALLAFSSLSCANSSLPENRHISLSGTAQLQAKADIAVIKLEVESVKLTSLEAKKEVDDRVNNLLAGLAQFNIDEDNVSAASITTRPKHSYVKSKQVLVGYTAHRNIKVTLNNIKKLNAFMDFALSVKIDKINNIELKSSKADTLKDEVITLAVKNAKVKGKSLAKAFDATLGKIYSINTASNQNRYQYGANKDVEVIQVSGLRKGNSVSSGKYLQENIIFSASINVVFDLDVK